MTALLVGLERDRKHIDFGYKHAVESSFNGDNGHG